MNSGLQFPIAFRLYQFNDHLSLFHSSILIIYAPRVCCTVGPFHGPLYGSQTITDLRTTGLEPVEEVW